MKEFLSLESFAKHLQKLTSTYPQKEFVALQSIGTVLEKKAKDSIGHLQSEAGPFVEWAELAESTKLDKERQGYVFNDEYNPLYRTGDLMRSIHHVVNKPSRTLYVGSDSDIMVWQEKGTLKLPRIPPRSVLGMTMFKQKHNIELMLGLFLVLWAMDKRFDLKAKP